ncbi:alginate export family protein [Methylomonas sp. AM2-LC]|uniref:alginate export family protein n=1 Tax=Methylomonas sp. AM2-LC TaxID=3153301 RepID=UPI003265892D
MKKQKMKQWLLPTALISMSMANTAAFADYTQDVEDALNFYHYGNNGAVKADINYRYENVNQDKGPTFGPHKQFVETANANTARLRLGLLSPTLYDFQAYAEYQGLYALENDYNQGVLSPNTQYSKVQDPQRSELDQLWLSYKGIDDTLVKFGRQRIKYDDDRFIGNVGWRQLEQTYDSVTLLHNYQALFGLTINAAYLGHMQDPLGQNAKLSAPLLNLNYKINDWGNVIGYGYWLDFQDKVNYAKSSQTYGLRFDGKSPKFYDTVNFLYTAEWGIQSNYASNPNSYTADRVNLMGGLTAFDFTLQGAMEQLDGYGVNKTFNTPLGTNHAFQGWADVIKNPLSLPGNTGATALAAAALGKGIRDVFATASYKMMNDSLILTGVYHDFFDDTGGVKFGSEWDFSVLKKFGKHYSLLAKYADFYTANSAFTDTQKIWLQGNITF